MLINLHHKTSSIFLSLILGCVNPFQYSGWYLPNGLVQTFPPLCAFDFQFGQRKRACWYIRKHSPWEIVCFVWLSPAPLFQSYNVLFARQPSKEGGGPRTKKRSGKVRFYFHFAILRKFILSNWKMSNLKKSQGILQQTWASLIFMVSSMSKIEPNVPH